MPGKLFDLKMPKSYLGRIFDSSFSVFVAVAWTRRRWAPNSETHKLLKTDEYNFILVEPILYENATTWDHFVLDSLDNEYVLKPWSNQNNRLCIQGIRFICKWNLPKDISKRFLKRQWEPSNNSPDRLESENLLLAYSPMNDLTTDFMNDVKGGFSYNMLTGIMWHIICIIWHAGSNKYQFETPKRHHSKWEWVHSLQAGFHPFGSLGQLYAIVYCQ